MAAALAVIASDADCAAAAAEAALLAVLPYVPCRSPTLSTSPVPGASIRLIRLRRDVLSCDSANSVTIWFTSHGTNDTAVDTLSASLPNVS